MRSDEQPAFEDYGLSAFTEHISPAATHTRPLQPHTHLELEMVYVERGGLAIDFGGVLESIRAGEIAVYWGGLPHAAAHTHAATFHVAQLPLVAALSWHAAERRLEGLLRGDFIRSALAAADRRLHDYTFPRWTLDLQTGDAELRAIVDMEIQSCIRRLLHKGAGQPPAARTGTATAAGIARAVRFISRHFMSPLRTSDIAAAVGWSRDHLMESFRAICGLTVWEYVTRVRVSEAARLLANTDLPVLAVATRSGFSSTSRLYDAFHRYHASTPAQYRRAHQSRPMRSASATVSS